MSPSNTVDNDRGNIPENRRAPEGKIWECRACGKQAVDKYGIIGYRSYGWDESCMLNSELVDVSNTYC